MSSPARGSSGMHEVQLPSAPVGLETKTTEPKKRKKKKKTTQAEMISIVPIMQHTKHTTDESDESRNQIYFYVVCLYISDPQQILFIFFFFFFLSNYFSEIDTRAREL